MAKKIKKQSRRVKKQSKKVPGKKTSKMKSALAAQARAASSKKKKIKCFKPDVVGFSVFSHDLISLEKSLEITKRYY